MIKKIHRLFEELNKKLSELEFSSPVTHVYNPLEYAYQSHSVYVERFLCGPPDRILLLGMNPGPWGMAQTGVPFGEVTSVRDWLGIEAPVGRPKGEHPKRPVQGFDCHRSEVSGRRLWGLFQKRFPNPKDFAQRLVVVNYCPLIFLEESGRNRTPDRLKKAEREALFASCDDCLIGLLETLGVSRAFGVGKFAEKCLTRVQGQTPTLQHIHSILHPSPANPQANRGWEEKVWPTLESFLAG